MDTAAVIGAGTGMGYRIARRFGMDGYRVALVPRNSEKLRTLSEML